MGIAGSTCTDNKSCLSGVCKGSHCCVSTDQISSCVECEPSGECIRCEDGSYLSHSFEHAKCLTKMTDGATCSSDNICISGTSRGSNCCGNKGLSTGCIDCDSMNGGCEKCAEGFDLVDSECHPTKEDEDNQGNDENSDSSSSHGENIDDDSSSSGIVDNDSSNEEESDSEGYGDDGYDGYGEDKDEAEVFRCEDKAAEAAAGWMGVLASDMTREDKALLKSAGAKTILSNSLDLCMKNATSKFATRGNSAQTQREHCAEVARKETALALGEEDDEFTNFEFKQLQEEKAREALAETAEECMKEIKAGYESGAYTVGSNEAREKKLACDDRARNAAKTVLGLTTSSSEDETDPDDDTFSETEFKDMQNAAMENNLRDRLRNCMEGIAESGSVTGDKTDECEREAKLAAQADLGVDENYMTDDEKLEFELDYQQKKRAGASR